MLLATPITVKMNKRLGELNDLIGKAELREKLEKQLIEARELSSGNDEMAELAKSEAADAEPNLPGWKMNYSNASAKRPKRRQKYHH
jgi:hypothetical protein